MTANSEEIGVWPTLPFVPPQVLGRRLAQGKNLSELSPSFLRLGSIADVGCSSHECPLWVDSGQSEPLDHH